MEKTTVFRCSGLSVRCVSVDRPGLWPALTHLSGHSTHAALTGAIPGRAVQLIFWELELTALNS